MGVASVDRKFTSSQTTGHTCRKQVGAVDGKAVDLTDTAVPHWRHGVTGQVRLTEIRELQLGDSPNWQYDPTAVFRDVLLVKHLAEAQDDVQNFRLTNSGGARDGNQRSAGYAKVDCLGDTASGCTLVTSGWGAKNTSKHIRVDGDLQLLRSVIRPQRQRIQIRLHVHDIVKDRVEVFAATDVQRDGRTFWAFQKQRTICTVVADCDRRLGADTHAVALVLDLALIVGIRDRRQDSRGVELLDQLARPDFRDETVGRKGVPGTTGWVDQRGACARGNY